MPDTQEQDMETEGSTSSSASYPEENLEEQASGARGTFKPAQPMSGPLAWKNQPLIALSLVGVCVVLLAMASVSDTMRPFAWLLALASFGALGFLGWVHMRQQSRQVQSANSEGEHVNASIQALAQHLKIVGEGELTHPSPVVPGALGRVGQLLDGTFHTLASHVSQIQENASRVEENAIDATTAINTLLEQAQAHASHHEQTHDRSAKMAEDLSWIAEQSSQVSRAAASAMALSSNSAGAVSGMSGKIDEIRAAAVEAGTRVERLGGFSRELTSLVDLLSRLADQASVVALQASLQSEKAGAAGHGFRIVSESMEALAIEIQNLARRGSSITTAAASDIDASSAAVEQVVMGSDDIARLMDVASETAHQSMETGKGLDGLLDGVSTRASQCAEHARELFAGPNVPAIDPRHAAELVALVASVRELNQKLGRLRP